MIESRPDGAGDATVQMACFVVGEHTLGLDIMRIAEVVVPLPIARVPGVPPFVVGIARLRGAFLAVIDLRERLGLPPPTAPVAGAGDAKYIVVSLGGRPVGLQVDAVLEVRRVEVAAIQPPPPLADPVTEDGRRYFAGVVTAGERVVLVLDLDQVLSGAETDQLAEFGPGEPPR